MMPLVEGLDSMRYRRPLPGSQQFAGQWIFVGTPRGMRRHKARAGSLIAPFDADPATFAWPAQGRSIMLISDGAPLDAALKISRCLIRDGADLVLSIEMDGEKRIGSHYAYGANHPRTLEARA
jgi:hypothetical protein